MDTKTGKVQKESAKKDLANQIKSMQLNAWCKPPSKVLSLIGTVESQMVRKRTASKRNL